MVASSASSRRGRAAPSRAVLLVSAVLSVLAAAAGADGQAIIDPIAPWTSAAAALLPDPSPSLRSKGDTLYTTLRSNATTGPAAIFGGQGSANGTNAVKKTLSDASHAVTNAMSTAKNPLGNATIEAFMKIDALDFAAWNASAKTCSNSSVLPKPKLSFAFQGSGLLLPFYSGVVQALQDRRVLSPAVSRSASFGGQSGGAITAVLTALGVPGLDQYKLFLQTIVGVAVCKAAFPAGQQQEAALACSFNKVGLPLLAAAIKAKDANATATINNRVTLWACQVDVLSTTLLNGVAQGTSKWADVPDILSNIGVSDMIPCFTDNGFYNTFRGSAFIDGGYCSDFAQLCPGGLASTPPGTKCLKMATTFLGPDLRGTPMPTVNNCPASTPRNKWVNVGKGYYTPADEKTWTLPNGSCLDPAAVAAAKANTTPFVPFGVTARPDIHPTFYAPLPAAFASGCEWLGISSAPPASGLAGFDAVYAHGVASGLGWADENGYCA